jgi:hypothetical protein
MMRKLSALLLILLLGLVAAGCGGDDPEVTIEGPNGGGVEVGGDGDITIEGPSGEVNIGTGDYPEGWPSDFPVPEGATPAYSIGAADGVAVWFATDQSVDEVKAFYASALPAAGFTIDSSVDFDDPAGSYTVMAITGNGWTGGIYMGEGAGAIAAGFQGDFDFWVTLTPDA